MYTGTYGTGIWANVIYLQYSTQAPTAGELATLANTAASNWGSNLGSIMSTAVTLTGVALTDLASNTGAQNSVSVSIAGTRAGTSFNASSAGVVSWKVNLRYRGGHFRTYLPCGVTTDVTGNRLWVAGSVTAFNAAASAWRTSLNALTSPGNTYQFVGVSYRTAHAIRPTPLVLPVTGQTFHGRVDTQRHRLGKETP